MVAAGFAIGAKNDAKKAPATKTTELKTEMDKVSYIIGTNIGRSFKQGGLDDLSFDAFLKGIKDVFANKDLAISEPEMKH
jgi:FKBP-type peptidyl-prolyl cis-trans isomerase FklB